MSKRSEIAALKAYPVRQQSGGYDVNRIRRKRFQEGYEQAEKDLALTLEDIVRLNLLIMGMEAEGYNEGYKTRPFYEEVLRRFNEQYRKK